MTRTRQPASRLHAKWTPDPDRSVELARKLFGEAAFGVYATGGDLTIRADVAVDLTSAKSVQNAAAYMERLRGVLEETGRITKWTASAGSAPIADLIHLDENGDPILPDPVTAEGEA